MAVLDERAETVARDGAEQLLCGHAPRAPRAPLGTGDAGDRRLDRAMRMIDPAVAGSFTPEQRRAIRIMLGLRGDRRLLFDLRGGFELAGRRYFLTLLGGHERRRRRGGESSGLRGWLANNLLTLILGGLLLGMLFLLAASLRG